MMPREKLFKVINISFIFLLFFIFFYGLGNYGLLAKDEPRYAGCALEMIENNNFIVPKFNFQDRFDKPALYYWLIASSYKTLGISSFSSRVPSALCAILLVLFTWYTSSKVLGKIPGLLSAMVLATSIEYIFLGRRAATDITLCLFFSGSLFSMYLGYFYKDWKIKILWTILSGIFAGLAILTKGPIGLVLQLFILTVFLIYRKQLNFKHIKIYFMISAIALAISLPWYITVHKATNGGFTRDFFFTHNLERFTSVVGEHPGPFWFYIPVLAAGFMPWTLFFIPALLNLTKRFKKKSFNRFIAFCIIWACVIFLFFSTCKTKLFTYILLLFPAISIITGYSLATIGKKSFIALKKSLISILIGLLCLLVAGYFIVPGFKLCSHIKDIIQASILISFSILALTTSIIYSKTKSYFIQIASFSSAFAISFLITMVPCIFAYHKITFADLSTFAAFAKEDGAKEIFSFGGYKPILVYYGRVPVDFNDKWIQIKKIREKLSKGESVYLIGYLSDIEMNRKVIKKNKDLFINKLKILKSGKRYFLGKIS